MLSDSLEGLQANLLPSLPPSLRASSTHSSQDQGPCSPSLPGPSSWAPPPQIKPTHPQAPLLKAGPLSDRGSGSPGSWGHAGHRLSQNCCCSRSTGLASALPTVSAVGLLPCLLDSCHSCGNGPLELGLQLLLSGDMGSYSPAHFQGEEVQ